MAVITGGHIIEGSSRRSSTGALDADVAGYGPYISAGVPASGFLNNIANKGALVIDTTNAVLYQNSGTLTATVWTKVGLQT